MVRLTEEMVTARTRCNDYMAVKKLNCWGAELTDISILRKMKQVQVLSLSVNKISGLADFQNCVELEDLFVRKNEIADLNEVCYLQKLPKLRNLWLSENPCSEEEGYRFAVIRALPNLEKLDDKVITPEELQTAMLKGKPLTHPMAEVLGLQPGQSCCDLDNDNQPKKEVNLRPKNGHVQNLSFSSNPLVISIILCLVNLLKELDYHSLGVVDMAVKSGME